MACPNQSLFQLLDFLPKDPLSSWTKPRVRLIGTDEVLVQADSLNIDGAILANAEVNEDGTLGEDKGNMSIDVNELTITDQKNKEESWSEGFSFSTSMGGNFKQGEKAGLKPGEGSTAIGANNSGSKTEGIAYGVLGKTKSLTVAGEDVADDSEILAGKHRDISETSVVTKEETTGGLNVDLTISNAYLGKNGLTNLKNDLSLVDDMVYTKESGWGGNTKQATQRVGDAAADLATSVAGNGLNVFKKVDNYQDKTARRESFAQLNKEELDVVANPDNYTESEKKAVADKYNATYAGLRGIDVAETNVFDDEMLKQAEKKDYKGLDKTNMHAFTDGNAAKNDIYLEVDSMNEGTNFAKALGHENKRHDQAENGIVNKTPDGVSTKHDKEAIAAGKHSESALQREMKYKGVSDTESVGYTRTAVDYALIQNGSDKAGKVGDAQPLTIFVHGTNAGPETADPKFIKAVGETFNEDVVQFEWTGNNSTHARSGASEDLWALIKNHDFKDGEGLNIITHSHGGNVLKHTSVRYDSSHNQDNKTIDNVVFLGTPHREDYQLDRSVLSDNSNVVNVFDKDDKVQTLLGGGLTGIANQRLDNSINLEVDSGFGPVSSHLNLDSEGVWKEVEKVLPSE